jgi:uncharacterized protein
MQSAVPIFDTTEMIAAMRPELLEGDFVFASTSAPEIIAQALPLAWASLREAEGLSLILRPEQAEALGLSASPPMRCLTLQVFSSLEGVGLTAAVAVALAEQGIACNMVAGCHHDHAFVPADRAEAALTILQRLQAGA